MNDSNITIPYTELRAFYKMLRIYSSTHFHHSFAKEVARAENAKKLADQFCRSVKHFKNYKNRDEKFIGEGARKDLPCLKGEINNTQDAAAYMENGGCTVLDHPELSFLYVDREIVPARTKKARFVYDDESATRNRSADLLLKNADDARPIIGEVKVKGDANPFLALIQLLMHAAEMVTPNQVERLKNSYPDEEFQVESDDCPEYDLYLVMFDYGEHFERGHKELWEGLLEYTKEIANGLMRHEGFSKYIRRIVCLELPGKAAIEGGFELKFKAARDS